MSVWTHAICGDCWNSRNPNKKAATLNVGVEICCFCGEPKAFGIYIRENAKDIACKGESGIHIDGEN